MCFRAAMHSWHTKTPHSISSALRKAAFLGRSSLRICNLRDAVLKAAPGLSCVSVFCSNDPDSTRITGHSFGRLYGLRDLSTSIMLEYMHIGERERREKRERKRVTNLYSIGKRFLRAIPYRLRFHADCITFIRSWINSRHK